MPYLGIDVPVFQGSEFACKVIYDFIEILPGEISVRIALFYQGEYIIAVHLVCNCYTINLLCKDIKGIFGYMYPVYLLLHCAFQYN